MSSDLYGRARVADLEGKKWTRRNNREFMREYSRKLHHRARMEGIQHYGCSHCGTTDPGKRYTLVKGEGVVSTSQMSWPMLMRRGWPEEYKLYCLECKHLCGVYEVDSMVDGDQYLLFNKRSSAMVGSLEEAVRRYQEWGDEAERYDGKSRRVSPGSFVEWNEREMERKGRERAERAGVEGGRSVL